MHTQGERRFYYFSSTGQLVSGRFNRNVLQMDTEFDVFPLIAFGICDIWASTEVMTAELIEEEERLIISVCTFKLAGRMSICF